MMPARTQPDLTGEGGVSTRTVRSAHSRLGSPDVPVLEKSQRSPIKKTPEITLSPIHSRSDPHRKEVMSAT